MRQVVLSPAVVDMVNDPVMAGLELADRVPETSGLEAAVSAPVLAPSPSDPPLLRRVLNRSLRVLIRPFHRAQRIHHQGMPSAQCDTSLDSNQQSTRKQTSGPFNSADEALHQSQVSSHATAYCN